MQVNIQNKKLHRFWRSKEGLSGQDALVLKNYALKNIFKKLEAQNGNTYADF